MKMSISDPGNGFWTLHYSTDLANWYPFQAIKVNNSSYAINLHLLENTPRAFYRASYDAAQQTGSNSVGQSLLLPALADNFSNPSLPPHFLAPQIVAQDNAPLNNPTTDAGATLGNPEWCGLRPKLYPPPFSGSCVPDFWQLLWAGCREFPNRCPEAAQHFRQAAQIVR